MSFTLKSCYSYFKTSYWYFKSKSNNLGKVVKQGSNKNKEDYIQKVYLIMDILFVLVIEKPYST